MVFSVSKRKDGGSPLSNSRVAESASQDIMAKLVENAEGPIFSLDRHYNYTSFNRAHASLMKTLYGAEIEHGHSLAEYMNVREDWNTAKANIDRALSGESFLESTYSGDEGKSQRCLAVVHNPIKTEKGIVSGVAIFVWDITERRQAEETALRESEKRFRTIVDFTYDWEYWLLPEGTMTYISPACERISGYTAAEFQQDPELLTRITHPDDRAEMELYLQATRQKDCSECYEKDFRIITRSGAVRWIGRACRSVYDQTGEFLGCRASLRDITDRKIKETEMRTLQMAVESVAASIIITNIEAEIEYVNPKFTEITGYTLEESVGRNPRFLKDPGRPSSSYKELWDTITAGKTWQGTVQNVKKNGENYWESATISPIFDETGKIIRYVAVKEDITERRQADLALRESEEKFKKLVRKTPLPLCFVNWEGNVGYINDRFTEVFGYTGDDLPTVAQWWEAAYPDEKYRQWARKKWEDAVKCAARDGKDIEAVEYSITCKNGEVRIVMASGIILDDNFLASFTDITERRRQERLLKASYERKKKNELLNELVQERLPSKQALTASARMLGMRVIEPFNCYLVVVDSYCGKTRGKWTEHREEYQQMIDSVVDELADDACVTWESGEGIGVLCFDTVSVVDQKTDQLKQAANLRQIITRALPEVEVSIGIAERSTTLTEISSHYRQAAVAVNTGRKVWPQTKCFHYLDIGVFQLLPYVQDKKQIDSYIERTLGNLLRYDKKKRAEYVETLETIIKSDNLKEAASQLSIHYKSLMFRKQRLEEILGISLDNFSSRMAVATAVHLMKLREEPKE